MLFQTPAQFIALALVLLAGWLFGLATAPGGRRSKDRLRDAEAAHTANRVELENRLRSAETRADEAERDRDRLARVAHDAGTRPGGTGGGIAGVAVGTAAASGAHHHTSNGLFAGRRDDLTQITGVDSTIEARLHDQGIREYRQIEGLSATDEAELERRLGLPAGTVVEQRWREQAAVLNSGRATIRPTSSI